MLTDLEQAGVGAFVDGLDPACILPVDAKVLVGRVDVLVRRLEAAKAVLAARVAESTAWAADGDRTPAGWLARSTGVSVGAARQALDTAEHLGGLQATREALLDGRLSVAQAAEVTRAATADPGAEAQLLTAATRESLAELKLRADAVRAAAIDAEAREAEVHRARRLRVRREDGTFVAELRTTPGAGALLLSALEPYRRQVFDAARREGRHEAQEAYLADALLAMAQDRAGGSSRSSARDVKVIVRVDHEALVRGRTERGETCEIAGQGSVSVRQVTSWLDEGAFLAAVSLKGTDVSTVAHLGRKPRAVQETAVEAQGRECCVQGCRASARLELDHRIEWAVGRVTKVDELDWLCRQHHRLKTSHGYRLADGAGKRALLPP